MHDLQEKLNDQGCLFFPGISRIPPENFLSKFGELRRQEDGRHYYRVKAGERLQPEDGGALMPHTDDFNSEGLPPRTVALYCIRPDQAARGHTLIADGYEWIGTLPATAVRTLERPRRYRKNGGYVIRPFLERQGGVLTLRVSFGHLTLADDQDMREIMAGLYAWFTDNALAVNHVHGSLLLWDNWRMIHGRTAYSDLRRELRRYHLDERVEEVDA